MSNQNLENVYNIVKQQPALPIEVSSKLNLDSFLAKAILDQLVETGRIKISSEKVGSSRVYFIPGQEVAADSKIKNLLGIKPTAKNFATSPVPQGSEIEKKRADFMARLKEIEEKEAKENELIAQRKKQARLDVAKTENVPIEEKPVETPEPTIDEIEEEYEEPKPKPKEIRHKKDEPAKPIGEQISTTIASVAEGAKKLITGEPSELVYATLAWLQEKNAEIQSQELKKRGKEATIAASIPSSIGPMQFIVLTLNKKSISEDDLSVAYSQGVQQKVPVIITSKGKLSKPAATYLKTISGVVKFKQL